MNHINKVEQGILDCWRVVDDLDTLFEACCEDSSMTKDKASNIVLGLHELYQLKFDRLFREFEHLVAMNREQRDLIQAHQNEKLFAAMDEAERARAASEAKAAELVKGVRVRVKALDKAKKGSTKKGKKNG